MNTSFFKKQKNKLFFLTGFLLLFISCIIIIQTFYLSLHYKTASYTESNSILSNPYCGFYQIYGYTPSDSKTVSDAVKWSQNILTTDTLQLTLLEINLNQYSNTSLTDNALAQIDCILKEFSNADKQIILRFLYDWDGKAIETEPKELSQILTHMEQTSKVYNNYNTHVYILQGLFIGNYAEMHSSNYDSSKDILTLMKQLNAVTDKNIFLSVRTPALWRLVANTPFPLNDSVFSENSITRIGLFNDGMLGSLYDLGTYDNTNFSEYGDFTEKGTRTQELWFQEQLCLYVPNGGEVVIDNPCNDFDNAIKDLSIMHISYLNQNYDANVLNKWKNSTYTGNDVFFNSNGYDYIAAHLGYRYLIESSSVSFHSFLDEKATLRFALKNLGFAPAYRNFECNIILTNTKTKKKTTLRVDIDTKKISPGDTASFEVLLDVRSLNKGSYLISCSMQDIATKIPITFANENNISNYSVPLGNLTID